MARQISNYRDLQDAVIDWLNRDDLNTRVPTFIYLAERKIFRRYRAPSNEKTLTYRLRSSPQYDSGGSTSIGTEIALTNYIDLPIDYLEALTVQQNGVPIKRDSLTELQRLTAARPGSSEITHFARERKRLLLWPFPDGDVDIRLIYYADFSGLFTADNSDNDVLRTAPDLYLYGSLVQAEPFLRSPEELALLEVWKGLFEEAFTEVDYQDTEDERSGSNVTVKSAWSGG
jgi:hypothetical protein